MRRTDLTLSYLFLMQSREFLCRLSLSLLTDRLQAKQYSYMFLLVDLLMRGTRGTFFPAEISYFLLKLKSTIMTLDSTKTY